MPFEDYLYLVLNSQERFYRVTILKKKKQITMNNIGLFKTCSKKMLQICCTQLKNWRTHLMRILEIFIKYILQLPKEVVNAITSIESIGFKQYKDCVEQRLELSSKSWSSTINKNKLPLMNYKRKVPNKQDSVLVKDERL